MDISNDLTTERLRIHPLDAGEFSAFLAGSGEMERLLGLKPSPERLDPESQAAMEWLALQMVVHPDEFPWWTNWQIILQKENVAVGSLCFKGGPDDQGGVEVGYGLYSPFLNQGIMTEALAALTDWALKQNGVLYVMAESEKWNLPSHRVLEKNGFLLYNETEEFFYFWRKNEAKGVNNGE